MTKTSNRKRCLSLLLAFVMTFSLVAGVLATEADAAYQVTWYASYNYGYSMVVQGGNTMHFFDGKISAYHLLDDISYCIDHGKNNGLLQQNPLDASDYGEIGEMYALAAAYGLSVKNHSFAGRYYDGSYAELEKCFVATALVIWEIEAGYRTDWSNDGNTEASLIAKGKSGTAAAYRELLECISDITSGKTGNPNEFYESLEEAMKNASDVDMATALAANTKASFKIETGDKIKDGSLLYVYYGTDKKACYQLWGLEEGVPLIAYEPSNAIESIVYSNGSLTVTFTSEFTKSNVSTDVKGNLYIHEDGETTPLMIEITRTAEKNPVVTGRLNIYEPTRDDWYNQSRIQFIQSDSGKTETLLYKAFVPNAKRDLTGLTKIWDDKYNKDGFRPNTVEINVKANDGSFDQTYVFGIDDAGDELPGTKVSEDGKTWTYEIVGLDADKEYILTETPLAGEAGGKYVTQYEHAGLTVINKIDDPEPSDFSAPEPEWTWPSFEVAGRKYDKEVGFDGDDTTPRGNATLAAGFIVEVDGSGGSSEQTVYADHNGYDAYAYIEPWSSTTDAVLSSTVINGIDTCDGQFITNFYHYEYEATITVTEEVPEGYLSEPDSKTGTGVRTYTITYIAEAERSVSDIDDDVTGDHESFSATPWKYTYTVISSDTGEDTTTGTAHTDHNVANPVYVNEAKKGQFQLIKTYDEDLDQWTDINELTGVENYLRNSKWTLELIDAGEDGNILDNGGSENHEYVRYVPITSGDPRYTIWGNSYEVVTDTSGVKADKNNPLTTNDYGQLYVYELPYGYYKLTELRNDANEGYVLETHYFYVTKDFDVEGGKPSHPSADINDEVIENEIQIVKVDSETGKTVPCAGVAFRIKYLGFTHSNPSANQTLEVTGEAGTYKGETLYTNAHSGSYITNGSAVDDGYQYVFYTDATGKCKIPYALEYGVWQLEEISAPYGYYIGAYGTDGEGSATEGHEGYWDTVAIYTNDGLRVDYTADPDVVYNYYQFEVKEQDKGEVVVQLVEMVNNSSKGKIEIRKVGEKLVGFTETESEYGTVSIPVYEMKPIAGAIFEIVAATDVLLQDGYERPELYDRFGNKVDTKLVEHTHLLWPEAYKTERAELVDGTQAIVTTTRETDNDGMHGELSKNNIVSAKLLSALSSGVVYEVEYETTEVDELSGIEFKTTYTLEISLEYAAGGWNYSYIDIARKTESSDYYSILSNEMPVIKNNGTTYELTDASVGVIDMPDGSSIDVTSVVEEYINENGVSVQSVFVTVFDDVIPDIQTRPKSDYYIADTTALTGISLSDSVVSGYNTSTSVIPGIHVYEHSSGSTGGYAFAVTENGTQKWVFAATADIETEEYYANAPDVSEYEAQGYKLGHEFVDYTGGDDGSEFHNYMFTLTKGSDKLYGVYDAENDKMEWLKSEKLVRTLLGTRWRDSYDTPLLDGFELMSENFEFGYISYSEKEGLPAILVEDLSTHELKWVRADGYRNTYLSRTVKMHVELNESKYSTDGFELTWGDFTFSNIADHEGEFSIATMINNTGAQEVFKDGLGCETETSDDGKTLTVKVQQPLRQAWYQLVDGTRVGITYLGGYTKTIIEVPHEGYLPTIYWLGSEVDYASEVSPASLKQTVDLGGGNYTETYLNQHTGYYEILLVSNSTTPDGGFTVDYYTGHTGYSMVVNDPETGTYRGLAVIEAIGKTLEYQTGTVIETLTTWNDGRAVSSLLPLGTYYVREVDAGLGYKISTESFQVDLTYSGQYVPLVWGQTSIENEALNVTIDISKSFQDAYGSDEYTYKAGAVFGVYNKNSITATQKPSDDTIIDKKTAEADSLLSIINIGEDGFATTSIKLPFMNDYYIVELDTLDGYTLSDVKYLFRVDEQTIAENLNFTFDHDGISGELNQTDLFETTIVIETLYQVPAKTMVVNGEELSSDAGFEESVIGDALVTNEVLYDRTITTIKAKDSGDTVIEFQNGSTLTVTVYSDGYVALFTDPTEDDCELQINKGNVLPTTIKQETSTDGTKLTFNPTVAYTGYTVDVTDAYRAPTTVMTTKDGVRLTVVFDKASGTRTAVLEYPKDIDLPEIKTEETWLTVNKANKTVTVDMAGLLASGNSSYEYKVILSLIKGTIKANSFSYIVASDKALTETDIKNHSSIVAKYDGTNASKITVDTIGLAAINAKIAEMYAAGDATAIEVLPLNISSVDAKGNTMVVTIDVELRASKTVASTLTGDKTVTVETDFPTYGKSVFFDITKNSFDIKTEGKACAYENGMRNDNISVKYENKETTISHRNKVFVVSSENNTSAVKAELNHDSSMVLVTMATGTVASAYNGIDSVDMTSGYSLNPCEVLTILASDGTLYTAKLDANGVFILHGEALINGTLATGTNAPSATVNGDTYYKNKTTVTETVVEFSESLTMARSSNNVSSIAVKINSKAENHMTDKQEDGSSTGRPDDIHNDLITVTFEKADMGGKPLAGAVIAVFDNTGKEVFRGTTDSKGNTVWIGAEPGTYTFREVTAPSGYELDSTIYTLVIYEDGTISGNRTLYNKELEPKTPTPTPDPKPDPVTIHKSDLTDGKPVSGATITVWNKETGRQIYSGVTDKNGNITFPKPKAGTYVFREVVAPDGYILNVEEFEFTVESNGKITGVLGITNERKPETEEPYKVTISKEDATDAAGVPGAEITVYDNNGKEAFKGITDENGKLVIELEKPGTYTFRETIAPDGYLLNETIFTFTLHEDGSVTGKTGIKNIREGTVVIDKSDIVTAKEVPGAEITVSDENGNVVFVQVTDEYGKIYFYPPAPGTYTFRETYSPDGYYINEEVFTFTVDEDGNITAGTTKITNVPVGTVVIDKTDVSDGTELPDAEITIWNEDGDEVFRGYTDERGRVYFVTDDWGPGTYTFRETIAPNGYLINEEIFTFTIDEDGVITGATGIKDQKIPVIDVPRTGLTDWMTILGTVAIILALGAISAAVSGRIISSRKKKTEGTDNDNTAN